MKVRVRFGNDGRLRRMAVGRIVMGLTQKALGERLGVTELVISKIETGRLSPSDDLRHKISAVLKIAAGEVGP